MAAMNQENDCVRAMGDSAYVAFAGSDARRFEQASDMTNYVLPGNRVYGWVGGGSADLPLIATRPATQRLDCASLGAAGKADQKPRAAAALHCRWPRPAAAPSHSSASCRPPGAPLPAGAAAHQPSMPGPLVESSRAAKVTTWPLDSCPCCRSFPCPRPPPPPPPPLQPSAPPALPSEPGTQPPCIPAGNSSFMCDGSWCYSYMKRTLIYPKAQEVCK